MFRANPKLALLALALIFSVVRTPELRAQAIDRNNPAWQHEMQSFQQFLTLHPWIGNKLRGTPSLANDPAFLRQSPELAQFLNAHPLVQTDFKVDANGAMSSAQQAGFSSPEVSYQETVNFKHFISAHPWTAGKLGEKPALANDKGFVKGDHEFQEFLNSHPYVQAQFLADPNGFMKQVQALPAIEPQPGNDDSHASDYALLKTFLQNHQWIADKLKDDPSRATNKEFLNKSKELREFLEAHPFLQSQFKQDARHTLDQALQTGAGQYF